MRLVHRAADLGTDRCVLVPTMGALHEGHMSLVRAATEVARRRGEPVIVTVFVNPTQFNEQSDFDRYPRTLDADAAACERAGADVVFAPPVEEVYPPDREIPVPPLPDVATQPGLEDAARPGHFAGVCQVVNRLFELTRPSAALFGEKDWQQLQVVRALTARGGPGVEIVGLPTVREPDGLAMSSRNRFIPAELREQALAIPRALEAAAGASGDDPGEAEALMRTTLERAGLGGSIDYAVVRDAQTLLSPRRGRSARALIAARVGPVRLIDNAPWGPGDLAG